MRHDAYTYGVKATIEIPDDLYRKVKAKSALQGRPIRAITIELFQRWIEEDASDTTRTPAQALDAWFALADDLMTDAPVGPTTREHLAHSRNRLGRQ